MNDLAKYRHVCVKYLLSRVRYFNEPSDELLDAIYRQLKNLPPKPVDDDQYNGLLGHKPILEQRTRILHLLEKELSTKKNIVRQDLALDSIVRYINKLKKRTLKIPYTELFNLVNVDLNSSIEKASEEKSTENNTENNTYNAASNYNTRDAGINLMHKYEGYRECTYKDPGSASGLPITGGWGSTRLNGKKLQLGKCYSKEIWYNQFKFDLTNFENAVKRHVKVPITQGMFDALVSFCYNCGEAALMNSTGLKRLNEKNYQGCWVALGWWNKGANGKVLEGLVKRRKAEGKLAGFNI